MFLFSSLKFFLCARCPKSSCFESLNFILYFLSSEAVSKDYLRTELWCKMQNKYWKVFISTKKNFKKALIALFGLASAHLLSQGVRLEKEPFEPFELIITNLNHS